MTTIEIAPHDQAAVCNFGYARSRCRHFPPESNIDAVRFSMVASTQLIWITECEHAPVSYGTEVPLVYEALAKAFVDSHRKRTSSDAVTSS